MQLLAASPEGYRRIGSNLPAAFMQVLTIP